MTRRLAVSIEYDSEYTTSVTPHCTILTVQRKQGHLHEGRRANQRGQLGVFPFRRRRGGLSHSRVAVKHRSFSSTSGNALATCLQQGILFRVQAQALVEPFPHRSHDRAHIAVDLTSESVAPGIAPGAPAFAAILDTAWRAIVAGADHSFLAHKHGAHSAFHAIRPERRKGCQKHEIRVPRRPQSCC